MSYLGSIYSDFTLKTMNVYNKFDTSFYKLNTNLYLKETADDAVMGDMSYCISSIETALNTLAKVKFIDRAEVAGFFSAVQNSPKANASNITVKGLNEVKVSLPFKTNYLKQFVSNFGGSITRALNEGLSENEYAQYRTGVFSTKLKKQIVSTSLPYNYNIQQLNDVMPVDTQVVVSSDYISSLRNFVTEFISNKTLIESAAVNVINDIKQILVSADSYVRTLNDIKNNNEFSVETLKNIESLVYNGLRTIMDAVSFVSICLLHMIHTTCYNVSCAMEAYDKLKNIFSSDFDNITESMYDYTLINSEDDSLGAGLLNGRIDIYENIASNIFDYHKNMADNGINPLNLDMTSELRLDEYEYPTNPYKDALACINIVGESLTILDKNTEDYMMVFDDIVTKAGLSCDLTEKFIGQLANIEHLPEYESQVENMRPGMTTDIGLRMLHEVKAYPENMRQISDTAKGVFDQLASLRRRLQSDDSTGEFKNIECINELVEFSNTLEEDYKKLVSKIASLFLNRLKTIGSLLEKISVTKRNVGLEDIDTTVSVDFVDMATESCIEELKFENNLVLETMSNLFYIDRMLHDYGIGVVIEAEGDATQTTGNTQQGNQQQPVATNPSSTKPTVTDNSGENAKTSKLATAKKMTTDAINKIKNNLAEWFSKMLEKLQALIDRQGAINKKWLADNKESLLNRKYNGLKTSILPFEEGMPYASVAPEIGKLVSNIQAINPSVMSGIKSQHEMNKKLFSFISPSVLRKDADLATAITQHYKVGSLPFVMKEYKNGDLARLVSESMIPYCEKFYDSYINDIKKQLKTVETTISNAMTTFKESEEFEYAELRDYFRETGGTPAQPDTNINASTADQTQNTKPQNNTDGIDLATKTRWMREAVKTYCGSIINALRDRCLNYFDAMKYLVPKNANPQPENNQVDQNQANANQTQNVEQNQEQGNAQ